MSKKFIFFGVFILLLSLEEASLELMLRYPSLVPDKLQLPLHDFYLREDQVSIQFLPECSRYDNELFYTLKPGQCNFSGRYFNNEIKINSLGVRDDEFSLNRPEIIVLGDSYAMGWGVEKNETFSDIIEKKPVKRF